MEIENFTVEPNSSYEEVGKAEPNRARHQTKVEEERETERVNNKWIGVLVVALFFQALLLTAVVVAAGFFSKEITTFYGQIEQLREQVQYMKQQLHQANDTDIWLHLIISSTLNSTTISNQLSDFQSSVNTFNATTTDPLSNLQSSVNTLIITLMDQQSSLQSSVDTLTTAQNSTNIQVTSLKSSLNTLSTQQASTTSHVNSLQSSVDNLTSQINSSVSVDIYKGCFEETTNCTLSESSSDYWRACRTRSVYIDPSVSSVACNLITMHVTYISYACHL